MGNRFIVARIPEFYTGKSLDKKINTERRARHRKMTPYGSEAKFFATRSPFQTRQQRAGKKAVKRVAKKFARRANRQQFVAG